MELQNTKCKNCGAALDGSVAVNGVIECGWCHSVFTVAKQETNKAALNSLWIAEHELEMCHFDEAFTAYRKAAELDNREPEAFWGMAIAAAKVQYIKDVVNNRLQPICHEISDKKITDDKNYLYALQLASTQQRVEYIKKANEIDYIREQFYVFAKAGLNYDCFICVKVTGENGEWTEDYKDADYIYRLLQDNGFSPFFSERDIRNKTGADYEAMILYALYTAETMLVVCRNEAYLQTPWVKNEYTRFLKLVNDEKKENDSITVVFNGSPIERLPGRNGKLQGINFAIRDADGKIVDFVENHTPESRKRREEESRKKAEQGTRLLQQLEEQRKSQVALSERLSDLQHSVSDTGMRTTTKTLLVRARQEFERGNFEESKNYCNEILNVDPQNGSAWTRLFLAEVWQTGISQGAYLENTPDVFAAIPHIDKNNMATRYEKLRLEEESQREGFYSNRFSKCYSGNDYWTLHHYSIEEGEMIFLDKSLSGMMFAKAVEYGTSSEEFAEMVKATCNYVRAGKPALQNVVVGQSERCDKAKKDFSEIQERKENNTRLLQKLVSEEASAKNDFEGRKIKEEKANQHRGTLIILITIVVYALVPYLLATFLSDRLYFLYYVMFWPLAIFDFCSILISYKVKNRKVKNAETIYRNNNYNRKISDIEREISELDSIKRKAQEYLEKQKYELAVMQKYAALADEICNKLEGYLV